MAIDQSFLKDTQAAVVPVSAFPAYVTHRTAAAVETETAPASASAVAITPDADAWFSGGTAVVPSGDVSDGTGSFLIPAKATRVFFITPSKAISFIPVSGTVHVSFEYTA
jgi:hypothetical protein